VKLQLVAVCIFFSSICWSVTGIHWAQTVEGSEVLVGSTYEDVYEVAFGFIPFVASLVLFGSVILAGRSLFRQKTPDWNWYATILIPILSFCVFIAWIGWLDNAFP
jgi:hypothetical protein